jgi:polyphosphate glucokinase
MATSEHILTIDVGGSHIKGTILDTEGNQQMKYQKLATPANATPPLVLNTILELVRGMPEYGRVSVGFPGYVRNGIVFTAPNLQNQHWKHIEFGQQISDALGKPVRLVNDADQLGLGVISGKGFELAVTLGTGFGTAVLIDGCLLPHLELAHHPLHKDKDYDAYIGEKAMKKAGKEKWNKRVEMVLGILKTVFNYDRLYLGGGNASRLTIPLESNVHLFTNEEGICGGARLWKMEDKYHITTNYPKAGATA